MEFDIKKLQAECSHDFQINRYPSITLAPGKSIVVMICQKCLKNKNWIEDTRC